MAIDTPANPAAADHTYTVAPDGTVADFQPEQQGVISTTECAFRNGSGQVGDPVLVDGRRGTVEQFLFEPARERKGKPARPGGWKADVLQIEAEDVRNLRLDLDDEDGEDLDVGI